MSDHPIIGHEARREQLSRLLAGERIPQVMLFHGIPGIGKHRVARWFIQSLLCTGATKPCGTCSSCVQCAGGTHPDAFELTPNEKGTIPIGKSDEKGTVRWLIGRLSMTSVTGRYGVIINGIDNIPIQGQNALLKTLEEPPAGAVIILLSSNRSQVLPTILSRSTEFSFRSLTHEEISVIIRNHDIKTPSPDLIAAFSGGSFELAVMLTEEDNLGALVALLEGIFTAIERGGMINLEADILLKRVGSTNLLFLLVNALREILMLNLRAVEMPPLLSPLPRISREDLQKLIKIMMEIQKRQAFNLNLPAMIKAYVYAMENHSLLEFPSMPGA